METVYSVDSPSHCFTHEMMLCHSGHVWQHHIYDVESSADYRCPTCGRPAKYMATFDAGKEEAPRMIPCGLQNKVCMTADGVKWLKPIPLHKPDLTDKRWKVVT